MRWVATYQDGHTVTKADITYYQLDRTDLVSLSLETEDGDVVGIVSAEQGTVPFYRIYGRINTAGKQGPYFWVLGKRTANGVQFTAYTDAGEPIGNYTQFGGRFYEPDWFPHEQV